MERAIIDLLVADAAVKNQAGGWQITGLGLLIMSTGLAIFLLNPHQALLSATVLGVWVRVAKSCLK